jgi:hypothetical protein
MHGMTNFGLITRMLTDSKTIGGDEETLGAEKKRCDQTERGP